MTDVIEQNYDFQSIEKKTQNYWNEKESFSITEDFSKEKFYCLSMFPYPSGHLHMGHMRNYAIGDAISRYQRMLGKNVLQPIGWDAFGLPAENASIKNNIPPAKWTYSNIDHMRSQLKKMGIAYDWKREFATCDPNYYRWEQWLFIEMFKKGLIYKKNSIVNWDPVDQTVLANEQVINGRGWRSGAPVEQKQIPQWFFKITEYADELLNDLDNLTGWPEQVRTMQRNWIGRSQGVNIVFKVKDHDSTLEVFTTRPDTLIGVTYTAIACRHPLAIKLSETKPKITEFIESNKNIKVSEQYMATIEKKGIDTGLFAIHPITGDSIPIWITNYVVMDYGSGAVMAVPAHDVRDHEFATKYNLPIKQVIQPIDINSKKIDIGKAAFVEPGILINSDCYSGLTSEEACTAIASDLEKNNIGKKIVHFRLRDWGVSRQRYWGTPIPIIYCDDCGAVPVAEKDLPVILPHDVAFSGASSPLTSMPEFYETTCPNCKKKAKRETDTFDTFFESSWYYARFASYDQNDCILDDRAKYWTPVDQYIGGVEHAVMHLLYARFIHKVLRDFGFVNSDEPFTSLLTQGMVLNNGSKMSKSEGNAVSVDDMIEKYGADTARVFILFAAPPEQSLEWSDSGVEGTHKFIKRIWAFAYENQSLIKEINIDILNDTASHIDWKKANEIIKNYRREIYLNLQLATTDMERLQFNTVVSSSMKLINVLSKLSGHTDETFSKEDLTAKNYLMHKGFGILLRVLNPIAPHITQYLWKKLSYGKTILTTTWPKVVTCALQTDVIEWIVQVNGKLRAKIELPKDIQQNEIEKRVLNLNEVKNHSDGKTILKVIVVPNKLVNVVI